MKRNNKYITKVIAACLLGDGDIIRDEKHSRFIYKGISLERIKEVILPVTSSKVHEGVLETARHPFFDKFRMRMYGTGKKCVNSHYLTLLDWEFLSIWFSQKGSYRKDQRKDQREHIELYTQLFSEAENYMLIRALKEKTGLNWNLKHYKSRSGLFQFKLKLQYKQVSIFKENLLYDWLPYWDDDIVQSTQQCVVSTEMIESEYNDF